MNLLTTTMGSYPKPDCIQKFFRWFQTKHNNAAEYTQEYTPFLNKQRNKDVKILLDRATYEAVHDQVSCGIDIPTDGEVRRENYVYYHCRHLDGIDFINLARKIIRGVQETYVPVIRGKIKVRRRFLTKDWRLAQAFTNRPVKITVPGPLTIADTLFNEYYPDTRSLCKDLADALNVEIRALARAGCTHIQVDEPVFARNPDKALDYGIENLERCFYKVPKRVSRIMHMCCGYPNEVDQEDYPKADRESYFRIAKPLDESCIDVVSIEDAWRYNNLSLLERFTKTKVILGVVAIARSRVEPVEEIQNRLGAALCHIDPDRLIAGPDCGLTMLDRDTAIAKLLNMTRAAQNV